MLDGQYVEICPLKGAAIGLHWNACIGRPKQARKFPGSASRSVMRGCPCCWQRARRKRGKANQPGLRSSAPSFGLANHRARCDLSSSQKLHIRQRGTEILRLGLSKETSTGQSSLHLDNGGVVFEHCTVSWVLFVFIKSLKTHPRLSLIHISEPTRPY